MYVKPWCETFTYWIAVFIENTSENGQCPARGLELVKSLSPQIVLRKLPITFYRIEKWLSSIPPDNCRNGTLSKATVASFRTISTSLFLDNQIIRRWEVWISDSIVK